MYGTMPFYRACKKAGVKPIIGIETYLAYSNDAGPRSADLINERFHMLLLAQNQTGYLKPAADRQRSAVGGLLL